ncbi:MAG: recombination mediator RecR [Eubacteriales bacterium]
MAKQEFPPALEILVEHFASLPGVGRKSAQRLAFHILSQPSEKIQGFANALVQAKSEIKCCPSCQNLSQGEGLCPVCASDKRDKTMICVVADPKDVMALERSHEYTGVYHVLHGVISPMQRIGPDQLKIKELLTRVDQEEISEVIMATNPDTEGEATSMYLSRLLQSFPVKITRLAYGIPVGSHLEHTDDATLLRALAGRQPVFVGEDFTKDTF